MARTPEEIAAEYEALREAQALDSTAPQVLDSIPAAMPAPSAPVAQPRISNFAQRRFDRADANLGMGNAGSPSIGPERKSDLTPDQKIMLVKKLAEKALGGEEKSERKEIRAEKRATRPARFEAKKEEWAEKGTGQSVALILNSLFGAGTAIAEGVARGMGAKDVPDSFGKFQKLRENILASGRKGIGPDGKLTPGAERLGQHRIPGYIWDGITINTPSEVAKSRREIGDIETAISGLHEYIAVLDKYGPELAFTKQGSEMMILARDLHAKLKSPGIYNLGVLNGSDLEFLEDIVANPTSWKSYFKDKGGLVAGMKKLADTWAKDTSTKMSKRGYKRDKGEPRSYADLENMSDEELAAFVGQ